MSPPWNDLGELSVSMVLAHAFTRKSFFASVTKTISTIKVVTSQHCLTSLWRKTNINISWVLGVLLCCLCILHTVQMLQWWNDLALVSTQNIDVLLKGCYLTDDVFSQFSGWICYTQLTWFTWFLLCLFVSMATGCAGMYERLKYVTKNPQEIR